MGTGKKGQGSVSAPSSPPKEETPSILEFAGYWSLQVVISGFCLFFVCLFSNVFILGLYCAYCSLVSLHD